MSRLESNQRSAPCRTAGFAGALAPSASGGSRRNSPFGLGQRRDNSRRSRPALGGAEGEGVAGSASPLPVGALWVLCDEISVWLGVWALIRRPGEGRGPGFCLLSSRWVRRLLVSRSSRSGYPLRCVAQRDLTPSFCGLRQRRDNSRRSRPAFGGAEGEGGAGSASPLPVCICGIAVTRLLRDRACVL